MKNSYVVTGKYTVIFASCKNEQREIHIDTEKLPIVDSFPGTWCVQKSSCGLEYARISNGRKRKVFMHRLVMNAPKDMQVDHKNHNTLDNREENLRVVTIQQNLKNKLTVPRNNTSGIRGVSWSKQKGKWRARMYVEGKEINIGFYSDMNLAAEALKKAKTVLIPDSYEALFYSVDPNEKVVRSQTDSTSRNKHSPYKNIRLDSSTGKWSVEFNVNRKRYYVGLFTDIEEAKRKLIEAKSIVNENHLLSGQEQ